MDFTAMSYAAIDLGSINLLNGRHQVPIDEDSEDEDDKNRKVKLDLQLEKEFDALDTNALLQDSCNYATQYSLKNNCRNDYHCNHNLVNWKRPDNHDFTENILTVGVLPTPTMLNLDVKKSIDEESEDEDDIKRKIDLDKCLEAAFDYVNEEEILQNSSNIRVLSTYNGKSNFFPTNVTGNGNNKFECEEIEFVNLKGGFQYNGNYDHNPPENLLIGGSMYGATLLTSELRKHADSDEEDEDDVRRKVKLDQQLEKEFDALDTNALLHESYVYSSQISLKSDCSNHDQSNYNLACQVNKIRPDDHDFPENFLTSGALPTPTMLNLKHKQYTDEDSEDEDDIRRKIQLNKCLAEELNDDKLLNEMTDIFYHAPFDGKEATGSAYGKFDCKKVEIGNVGRGSHFIHMNGHRQMKDLVIDESSQETTHLNLGNKNHIDEFGRVIQQKSKVNLTSEKELAIVENDNETRQKISFNQELNYSIDYLEVGKNITSSSTLKSDPGNYFQFSSGVENNYDSNEKLNIDGNLCADGEILNHSNFVNNGTQSESGNVDSQEFRDYLSNVINAPGLDDIKGAQPLSNSEYLGADNRVDSIEVNYGFSEEYLSHRSNEHTPGLARANMLIETSSYNHLKQLYEIRGKELDRAAEQMAALKLKLDNVVRECELLTASKNELELFLTEKDNRIKGLYNDLKDKNESIDRILNENATIKCKLEVSEHKVSSLQLQVIKLKSTDFDKGNQNVQESLAQRLRAFHNEEVEDLNNKLENYRQRSSEAEAQLKVLEKKLFEGRKVNNQQLEEKIIYIKELQAKLKAAEQIQLLVSNPRSSSETDREKELIKEIESLKDKLNVSEKELKCYGMMLKNEVFKSLVPNEESSDCLGLMRNLNFDDSRAGTPDLSFAVVKSSSPCKRKIEELKQISNEEQREEFDRLQLGNAHREKTVDSKQTLNSALLEDNISLREQNVKLIENYSILKGTSEKLLLSMNEICNEIKKSPKNLDCVPYASLIEESHKLTKYMENFSVLHHQTWEQRNLETVRLKEHFLALHDLSLKEIKENMQIEYEGIIKCLKVEMNRLSEKLKETEDKQDFLFRERRDELKGELYNVGVYSNKIESQLKLCQNENMELKNKIEELQLDINSTSNRKVSNVNAVSITSDTVEDLKYRLLILENENKVLRIQVDDKTHIERDLKNLNAELRNLKGPQNEYQNPSDVREQPLENSYARVSERPGGLNELQIELNYAANQIDACKSLSEKVIELDSQLKSYKQQIREKDQQLKTLTSLCTDEIGLLEEVKVEQLPKEIKLLKESKANLLLKHGKELRAVTTQLRKQENLVIEMRKQWEVKLSVHNKMTRTLEKEREKLNEEINNINKSSVMHLEEKNKKYHNLKLKFFKLQKNKTIVDERLNFNESELKRCEGNESELLSSVNSWATQIKNTLSNEISLIMDEIKTLQKNSFLTAADLGYPLSHLSWILEKLSKLQIY